MRELEAIQASKEHWAENIKLAEAGELNWRHIVCDACALCQEFDNEEQDDNGELCGACPLYIAGFGCNTADSPWRAVQVAVSEKDQPGAKRAAENMHRTLEHVETFYA